VHVAHFELLDAFDLVGVVAQDWVDALAVPVAGDLLRGFCDGGGLRGWWGGGEVQVVHCGCGPGLGGGIQGGGICG